MGVQGVSDWIQGLRFEYNSRTGLWVMRLTHVSCTYISLIVKMVKTLPWT